MRDTIIAMIATRTIAHKYCSNDVHDANFSYFKMRNIGIIIMIITIIPILGQQVPLMVL